MKMLQLTTFNNGELLINMDRAVLTAAWDTFHRIKTENGFEFAGTYLEFEGDNSYPLVKERPAEIWRKIQELMSCEEDYIKVMIPNFHVDEDEE